MMIAEKVREELKNAMRLKDQIALDTLRAVISGFTNELVSTGKNPQETISDDVAITVIKKLVKQRKDSIVQFESAGRFELVEAEKAQLQVLEKYLPEQLSEEDILKIAQTKKTELNILDKSKSGILTGIIMKEVAGNADGALVKKVVDSLFE